MIRCRSSVTILKRDSQIAMLVILSSNIGVAMERLFSFIVCFLRFPYTQPLAVLARVKILAFHPKPPVDPSYYTTK